jgi:hypothetical protein
MNLYNRVGEIVLGRPGEVGSRYHGLNFKFDVKKTITSEMNPGTLSIYNLSPTTRRSIHELSTVCILKVGYADALGPVEIFRGYVSSVSTPREGPDLVTTLELRDGYQELRAAKFSKSYTAGVSIHTMIKDVVKSLKLPESLSVRLINVANKKFTRGVSFNGASKDVLDDLSRVIGVRWSIQSGRLKMLADDQTDDNEAVVISAATGLIGRPIRLSDVTTEKKLTGATTSTDKRQLGWRVESLVQPTIEPGNKVMLKSDEVVGFFKVVNVNHQGEIMGSDWNTTLEVVDV